MNPPLRTEKDVQAIKKGLADGVIDVIATDHDPHSPLEKDLEFDKAAFGIIGLETALPLTLNLVREGVLRLPEAIRKLSHNAAAVLGIEGGRLVEGAKRTWRSSIPNTSMYSRKKISSPKAKIPPSSEKP